MLRLNRLLIILLLVMLVVSCSSSSVSGLTITAPKPGSVFYPGDKVTVKAVTAVNERPIGVFLYSTRMSFSTISVNPPYELTFTIPLDFTGEDTIVASAKFSDGNIVEKEVKIIVVLPSNIIITGIEIDPNDFILLKKLPLGSDPNDVRIAETQRIGVGGMYSDGVERGLTSSTSGTTYTSSDEKVATVDKEGKVTAQGIGKAKITVKNGKYSAMVDVIVKPYK